MTTKIRLVLEYDGGAYVGWQRQINGLSVQEVVENALQQIYGAPIRLHASGRTDAGVHARGLVVHFIPPRVLPMTACREGVNSLLPPDIAVVSADSVEPTFHARYSARAKWYSYRVWQGEVRSPLLSRQAWHLKKDLDLKAMQAAAADLLGEHDFAAFRASNCDAKTTRREIFAVTLHQHGQLLQFDIAGSGFLRNMVRVIVGTLTDIGRGRQPVTAIRDLLASGNRCAAGVTAPAHGLCLMQVLYAGDKEDFRKLFVSQENSLTTVGESDSFRVSVSPVTPQNCI